MLYPILDIIFVSYLGPMTFYQMNTHLPAQPITSFLQVAHSVLSTACRRYTTDSLTMRGRAHLDHHDCDSLLTICEGGSMETLMGRPDDRTTETQAEHENAAEPKHTKQPSQGQRPHQNAAKATNTKTSQRQHPQAAKKPGQYNPTNQQEAAPSANHQPRPETKGFQETC